MPARLYAELPGLRHIQLCRGSLAPASIALRFVR